MKKLFVLAVILVIAGGIMTVIAFSQADWDVYAFDKEVLVEKSYTAPEADVVAIKKVYVDIGSMTVDLVVKGNEYSVVYYESDKYTYEVSSENGVFIVKEIMSKDYVKNVLFAPINGLKRSRYHAKVTIPENFSQELELEISNADIDIKNINSGKDIKIKTSNGLIRLENITAANIELKSSNAEIDIKNVVADKLGIKTSNGYIRLKDIVSASEIAIDTSNADIRAENVKCGDFKLDTSNGGIELIDAKTRLIDIRSSNEDIRLTGCKAEVSTKIKTSNGKVTVSQLESPDVVCETSNARIDINIKGSRNDYNVITIVSGETRISETRDTTQRVYLKTSNGRVEVSFS